MDKDKYEGWANYPTWAVALWIANDQGEYEYWKEQAVDAMANATDDVKARGEGMSKRENAIILLEQQLKDYLEDNAPETKGIYTDLLQAGMDDIDYYEIAEDMIDNLE